MSILIPILLISFLIFVHELGHFTAAKLFKVKVNEFAMFMGPAIAKWKWGETQYSIRCIPIGGYCAMEGEDGDSDNPRSFHKADWWKRLIILVAGAFMNFVIGIAIVGAVLLWKPQYVTTQIDVVEPWSTLSCEGGLQAGDTIVNIDGQRISIFEDFSLATAMLPDGSYDITVRRNGEKLKLENVPMNRQEITDEAGNKQMLYGISFAAKDTTFWSVPGRVLPTAMNHIKTVLVSLKLLITGKVNLSEMIGPVGIVVAMSEATGDEGMTGAAFMSMLNFAGFLSMNLMVMNLLPVPAADGGRVAALLITQVIEWITKKKVDPKYEAYIHGAGMVLLLGLTGLLFLKDFIVIFKR